MMGLFRLVDLRFSRVLLIMGTISLVFVLILVLLFLLGVLDFMTGLLMRFLSFVFLFSFG